MTQSSERDFSRGRFGMAVFKKPARRVFERTFEMDRGDLTLIKRVKVEVIANNLVNDTKMDKINITIAADIVINAIMMHKLDMDEGDELDKHDIVLAIANELNRRLHRYGPATEWKVILERKMPKSHQRRACFLCFKILEFYIVLFCQSL